MENLHTKDRIVRITIAAALLTNMLLLPLDPTLIAAMAFASFYPLMTALMAWDPIYHVFLSLTPNLYLMSDKETKSATVK